MSVIIIIPADLVSWTVVQNSLQDCWLRCRGEIIVWFQILLKLLFHSSIIPLFIGVRTGARALTLARQYGAPGNPCRPHVWRVSISGLWFNDLVVAPIVSLLIEASMTAGWAWAALIIGLPGLRPRCWILRKNIVLVFEPHCVVYLRNFARIGRTSCSTKHIIIVHSLIRAQ